MGGKGLRSFGNGQNRNKDFSQRNRSTSGRITYEQTIKAKNRLNVFFSFVDVVVALTSVTAVEIQAKHLYQAGESFALTQEGGWLVRESKCTCISKLPEDRHHAVKAVVAKLKSLGVGVAFGVVQCIHVHMDVVHRI